MADMEMDTDDDILKRVAQDGSMDYSLWPNLLPAVVSRIDKIAHHEFPIPHIPPPQLPLRPPSPRFLAPLPSSDALEPPDSSDTALSSQETNKENANPSPSPPLSRVVAATSAPSDSPKAAPSDPSEDSLPSHQLQSTGTLPAAIAAQLEEVMSTLTLNFSQFPPHTIQRLAELVLRPRQHYRGLVAYLHALDRVVHVTSGANIYPLPPAIPDMGAMSLLANGVGGTGGRLSINTSAANNIGSDEALGGALLTPIPWLARHANGGGSDDSSDAGSLSPSSAVGGSGLIPAQQQQPPQQPQPQQSSSPVQQQPRPVGQGSTGGRPLEGQVRTESTETIEGPNGMGSIETVSVSVNGIPSMGAGAALVQRGVTQGELLRQEQRAGVVPLSQLARQQQQQQQQLELAAAALNGGSLELSPTMDDTGASSEVADEDAAMNESSEGEDEDEIPHARGPEEIGAADTGPQTATTSNLAVGPSGTVDISGIDVEAAVGRRLQSPPKQQKTEGASPDAATVPESPKREADVDLEPGPSKKRVKEDQPGSGVEDDAEATAVAAGEAAETAADQLKIDAEGDFVIVDREPQSLEAAAASTAAGAEQTEAGGSSREGEHDSGNARGDDKDDDMEDGTTVASAP
ncbi:hypothetical protein B0T24DRAFT_587236 [Lasiosphaeria ovina]|uniref:Protein phosphatase 4 core regulatory subunit R2 n=1 Tax=Lasiosphaeria ovina TaxID=92902 RepID=A0AAE0NJ46_9PEZI|nr:hypothetical protein B0T24DRAFT_587236 [Lasiosphaeria ovina]